MYLYTWHCYYGLQRHICQGDGNYTETEAIKADTGTQKAVAGRGQLGGRALAQHAQKNRVQSPAP